MSKKEVVEQEILYNNLIKEAQDNWKEQFLLKYARFNVGSIIYGVTGIIRVEEIDCNLPGKLDPKVKYIGKPYKKVHGDLLPTKSKTKKELIDYGNLKYCEYNKISL